MRSLFLVSCVFAVVGCGGGTNDRPDLSECECPFDLGAYAVCVGATTGATCTAGWDCPPDTTGGAGHCTCGSSARWTCVPPADLGTRD
jgi:hypothetical protein